MITVTMRALIDMTMINLNVYVNRSLTYSLFLVAGKHFYYRLLTLTDSACLFAIIR